MSDQRLPLEMQVNPAGDTLAWINMAGQNRLLIKSSRNTGTVFVKILRPDSANGMVVELPANNLKELAAVLEQFGALADTKPVEPHSRACGIRKHDHGPECSTNCPTCGGMYPTIKYLEERERFPDRAPSLIDRREGDQ